MVDTSMEILSYFLLPILPLLFFIILKHYSYKTLNSPPSPPALPIIGHFHLINNFLHLTLASLSSRYGPIFALRFGRKSFFVVSSPSAIAECFTKHDIIFSNRPTSMAADLITYNYSNFLASPYGHLWRTLRRFSVVEMLSSISLQRSAQIRQQEILKIARAMHAAGGKTANLNYLISTYSYNIMMRALAGRPCVGEREILSDEGKETMKRIKATFVPAMELGVCDYFPVLRWIGYKGMEKRLICLHEKRDEFLESLFEEVRRKSDDEANLIRTLLARQASEPEFYTDDVVKSVVLVFIQAGTDTSALTMEWAMSFLLSHPEELQKVRREIDEHVGHDRLINDSDLAKLPYLGCVINETLRLQPIAPLLPRSNSEDCVVSGYNVPKGTILMVNAWAVHRDPNLWDEPEKFRPERFLEANAEAGHKFLAFGIGRRVCPGAAMALRTASLALGLFFQCFEWEKPAEEEEVDLKFVQNVTLRKAKPLQAVCHPRKEAAHLLSQL